MSPGFWLVCLAIGGVILVALAVLYRRAARQRELEIAEETLAAEYDALPKPRETGL